MVIIVMCDVQELKLEKTFSGQSIEDDPRPSNSNDDIDVHKLRIWSV